MGLRIQIFDPISPQCVIKPNLIDPVLLMEPGPDSQEEGNRTPGTVLVTVASERELLDCVRHLYLDYCLKEVFKFIYLIAHGKMTKYKGLQSHILNMLKWR